AGAGGRLPPPGSTLDAAVKNVAWFQTAPASRLTTASPAASSAITLIARGIEFGACTRNRASAAELMRADSLCIRPSDFRFQNADFSLSARESAISNQSAVCNLKSEIQHHTDAVATAGWAINASRAPSVNGTSGGRTIAADRTFWCAGSTPG